MPSGASAALQPDREARGEAALPGADAHSRGCGWRVVWGEHQARLFSWDSCAPQILKLCGGVFRFFPWCGVYFGSWKPFNLLQ